MNAPSNPSSTSLYGLFVNGKVRDVEYRTLTEAVEAATQLRFGGHEVTVFDRVSRQPIPAM